MLGSSTLNGSMIKKFLFNINLYSGKISHNVIDDLNLKTLNRLQVILSGLPKAWMFEHRRF